MIWCTVCERRWYWKDRVNNLVRTKGDGDAQAANRERQKSTQGIQEWAAAHPNSHDIVYEPKNLRWKCSKCNVHGALGFGARFEAAVRVPCGQGQKRALPPPEAAPATHDQPAKRRRADVPHSSRFPYQGIG